MIRNFVFGMIATAALTLSSVASANPAVYGNWAASQAQNGFTFTMVASIAANQTSLGAKCEYQGQAVIVSTTVPSEVTASQIILKGSGQESKQIGGLDCSVNVQPMAFDYQLNGDTLTLSAQGQTVPFTRVK